MNPSSQFALQSPLGPRVVIAGRERDYFSGTGYLGLHNHPAVLRAAIECIERYGLSTGTSRGGYGEHPVYDRLDSELRAFMASEAALYFASGYLGAAILCQGLGQEVERIFIDESAHFSVWDAARASTKPLHAYRHLDLADLNNRLQHELQPAERPLILCDGLFPISGEIAPLPGLLEAAGAYQGWVGIDDAHAAGVLGPNGRGCADYYGVSGDRLVSTGTLSKALGGFGGFLSGGAQLLERLESHSKVYVAASAPPLPVAAAAAQALQIARTQPELRKTLWDRVRQARDGLRALGWPLPDSPAPILCLGTRPGLDLGRIKEELFARDICVAHVRSYSSTPAGGALRIAIFASHTAEQVEHLLAEMAKIV